MVDRVGTVGTVGMVGSVGWQHVGFWFWKISNWAPVGFCHVQSGDGGVSV